MSLFDYRNFLFPFGGGVRGGAVRPPVIEQILQWLLGTSDGEKIDDKTDPLIVDPRPDVGGVAVLKFDGVGDYGKTPATVDITNTTRISAWIKYASGDSGVVVSYGAGYTGGKNLSMWITSSSKLRVNLDDDVFLESFDSDLTVTPDVWHLVETWADDDTLYACVDGSIDSAPHTRTLPITPTGYLTVGCVGDTTLATTGNFLDMEISQVTVSPHSNFPLGETEGASCYNAGSETSTLELVTTSGLVTMRAARSNDVTSWNLDKGFTVGVPPDTSNGWTPEAYGGFDVQDMDWDTLAQNVTIVADSDESAGFGFSEDGLTLVLCNDESKMFSYTCAVPFQVDALTPITTHTLSPQKNFISFNISPDGAHVIQWETGTKTVYHHTLSTPWDITTATLSESKALAQSQQSKGIWVSRDGTKMVTPGWSTLQDTSLWTFGTPWDASTLTLDHSHVIQNALVFSRMTFSEDGTTCICGLNGTNTYQYNFATPWDLTSAEPVITKGSENNYWNAGIWMNVDQTLLFTLRDNRNMKVYATDQGVSTEVANIPALEHASHSVATFDGVGDYVDFTSSGVTYAGDFSFGFCGYAEEGASADNYVWSGVSSTTRLKFQITGGSFFLQLAGGTSQVWSGIETDVKHEYVFRRTGNNTELFIDGVSAGAKNTGGDSFDVGYLGKRSSSYGASKLFAYKSTQQQATTLAEMTAPDIDYDFTNYEGKTTTTITDESGNGNDGTVTTADLDAFWAIRTVDTRSVATFSAVGDNLTFPIMLPETGDFDIAFSFNAVDTDAASSQHVFEQAIGPGGGNFILFINTGSLTFRFDGSDMAVVAVTSMVDYRARVVRSAGIFTCYLDGGSVGVFDSKPAGAIDQSNIYFGQKADGSLNFSGQMWDIAVADALEAPLDEGSGLVATDLSGNGNDGTITAIDINNFWVKHIVDNPTGTVVDAANYLPITNPGGDSYNNGFEGNIIEDPTAFNVIDQIEDGIDTLAFTLIQNGRPEYQRASASVRTYWDGVDRWIWNNFGDQYYNLTDTTFPPLVGTWVNFAGPDDGAPVLAYDSYMVEDGEFVANDITEDLARENTTQRVVDQWKKVDGVCLLNDRLVYSQSTVMDGEWIQDAEKWATKYTDECGTQISALRDSNGVLILDGNGDLQTP